MQSLESVTVTEFETHWEACFSLAYDVARTGESLVFALETDTGSRELTVRVERGIVADVAVWDSARARRIGLPFESAVLDGTRVECIVPLSLLAVERARARVLLNGALAGSARVAWIPDAIPGTAVSGLGRDDFALAGS